MKWVPQEGVQHGHRKPIPIEVAEVKGHPDRFLLYQTNAKKIETMWSLLDKVAGATYYLNAEGWEAARAAAEVRIKSIINPEPRRERLLGLVNIVESRRTRRLHLYERIVEIVRAHPGCTVAYLRSRFSSEASSVTGALQTARNYGLIFCIAQGRYNSKWYPDEKTKRTLPKKAKGAANEP